MLESNASKNWVEREREFTDGRKRMCFKVVLQIWFICLTDIRNSQL